MIIGSTEFSIWEITFFGPTLDSYNFFHIDFGYPSVIYENVRLCLRF